MKILEIIPVLVSGGGERFVIDLCNELCVRHNVTLMVMHSIEKYHFYVEELDHRVTLISMNKKMGIDLQLPFKINKEIKRISPDVIHTHLDSIVYTSINWLFSRKIPYIHTVHNDAGKESMGGIKKFLRILAFKYCNVIPVTISSTSHKTFLNFYNINATLIVNGRHRTLLSSNEIEQCKQELNLLLTSKEALILINVAKLNEAKNQETMAKAISELNAEGHKIEVFIIGNTEMDCIRKNIEALNCPQIHLLGEKKKPCGYIAAADGFTLPSKWEGMPISLIEAFSVGTIPVCTKVGGICDMIQDGENGLLSEGTDKTSLKTLYKRFIKLSDEQRKHMAFESCNSFKNYTIKKCARAYEDLMTKYSGL